MTIPILITRPAPSAQRFAEALRHSLGKDQPIIISPVTTIQDLPLSTDLTPIKTLIFTSREAVRILANETSRRDIPCVTVGEATATLAQEQGFEVLYASPTAQALLADMQVSPPAFPALYLRGETISLDMAQTLNAAGHKTQAQVLYRQTSAPLSQQAQSLLTGKTPVILPLFSRQSATFLFAQITPTAQVHYVAISQQVADIIPQNAQTEVHLADQPDQSAMVETIAKLVQN